MTKKKIQLEDLARMTQQGFLEMGKNFEKVWQKFGVVDKKLDYIERDVAEIKFHMTEMVRRAEFLALEQRVDQLETKVKKL